MISVIAAGVAAGVLAHIQAHQEQAKGHGAAQAIEQRTIGDHAHAALMQRLVAQLQRVQQVAVVLQHIGRCRRWSRSMRLCAHWRVARRRSRSCLSSARYGSTLSPTLACNAGLACCIDSSEAK